MNSILNFVLSLGLTHILKYAFGIEWKNDRKFEVFAEILKREFHCHCTLLGLTRSFKYAFRMVWYIIRNFGVFFNCIVTMFPMISFVGSRRSFNVAPVSCTVICDYVVCTRLRFCLFH